MPEEALIRFSCSCGQRMTAKMEQAGAQGRCPRCGASVKVPRPKARAAPRLRINYAKELNEAQYAAVQHREGPALVIAGAGTGKTRTLVYRLAYLIECGVPAENILLVTFTKKAAGEMLGRVRGLLGLDTASVTGGTFHHVANLILRRHAREVGLSNDFTIMDTGDAQDLIQSCRAEMKVGKRNRRFPRKSTLAAIFSLSFNTQKTLEETIQEHFSEFEADLEEIGKALELYETKKRANSLLDYDDLIRFTIRLMEQNERVRASLGRTYRHVMVDEYQDTNAVQDRMISLLCGGHRNLMVVGDDFQSIYSFRGADFTNIMGFPERYTDAAVYKLEHNYRSTPQIMDYTNQIIAHARVKFEKKLFSTKPPFMKPQVVYCEEALAQARFVARKILELYEQDVPLDQIGVLYRAHAHSIAVQVELERANLPFRVRSGLKFYELAHIKDLFALMKVLINPADVLSWTRILTLAPSVGPAGADRMIAEIMKSRNPADVIEKAKAPAQAREVLRGLAGLLRKGEGLRREPSAFLDQAYRGWYGSLMPLKYDDHAERERDVESFIDIAARYGAIREMVDTFMLEEEMVGVDPEAPETQEGLVTLSSIHQAKGLEWRAVFVIEMLEGAFPSSWSLRDPRQLEEERRLYYVAATRSKQYLYIVAPQMHRSAYGTTLYERSRFVTEIPADYYDVALYEGDPGEELPIETEDQ